MADETTQPADRLAHSEPVPNGPESAESPLPPGRILKPGTRKIDAHDFRNPAFLAEVELRRLRSLHEEFVRYLGARLSLHLRMDFGLKVASLSTQAYAKFTGSLSHPIHLSLFKVDPLTGVGILGINARLALTIADRLLGGRGNSVKAGRELTEIEIALIEDVVLAVLAEWCGQWKAEQELRPSIMGHETSGRFLQTLPRDAVMLAVTLECTFGDCSEQIQLGIPYHTIEPLVKKMQARSQAAPVVKPAATRAQWQPAYDRITMPVRAEWEAFELTLREVCSLRVGDVLEMPPALCAETRVLLNGSAKFVGTVGLDTDRVAVQLTRKLSPEDSFHAQPDGRKVP